MNIRRKFVAAFGVAALLAPLSVRSQAAKRTWRIGVLWENEPGFYVSLNYLDSFKAGLRELGYFEDRDYMIEQRSANGDLVRLGALAAELVALKVDILIPSGSPAAVAAHKVSRDLPILIITVGDPVASGLATTLRRPGGNVTGLTSMTLELDPKRLDLLRQLVPEMRRVGFVYSPNNDSDTRNLSHFDAEAARLNIRVVAAPVRKVEEIASAFNTLKRTEAQGVVVSTSATNHAWRTTIVEHAAMHRLPAVYGIKHFAEAGGLVSYGTDFQNLWWRAAAYADKIFKGTKSGELPIEQPVKFEMVINLKAAKSIGITIPQSLLLRADEVIQ